MDPAESDPYWNELATAYVKFRLKEEGIYCDYLTGPLTPSANTVTEYLCMKAYYDCEKQYETLLENAVDEVNITPQTTFPQFMKVCDGLLFVDGKIENDFVVCLFCLAGLLAVKVAHEEKMVEKVCGWLATFLDSKLSEYIENYCGGLRGCLDLALLPDEGGDFDDERWPTPYGYDKDSYEC